MNDPRTVRAIERIRDLATEPEHVGRGQRAAGQPLGQRFALDQLHDQIVDVPITADVVEGADVGVVEARRHARLALETRTHIGLLGELGGQDLDRHVTAEPGVPRPVDLAHPPRAERGDDLVRAETGASSELHPNILHQAAATDEGRRNRSIW
jgi:hypothetical protein